MSSLAYVRAIALAVLSLVVTAAAAASGPFSAVSPYSYATARVDLFAVGEDGLYADRDHGFWEDTEATGWWTQSLAHEDSLSSPDGTASASGQASVFLKTFSGPQLFSFESRASASAAGSAGPSGEVRAFDYGDAQFSAWFDITSPLSVKLKMDSSVGAAGSFFDFELARDDVVVWTDESVLDPGTGSQTRSFSRTLMLDPGSYRLSAVLDASAYVTVPISDHDLGSVAQTSASFILSTAPEPQTWLLMMAGLGLVGAYARRRRAAEPS